MRSAVRAPGVLPVYDPDDADEAEQKRPHAWTDAGAIGAELLKKSQALKLEPDREPRRSTRRCTASASRPRWAATSTCR